MMPSTCRPPPRGPVCSDLPVAVMIVLSNARQQALNTFCRRLSSAEWTASASHSGAMPGAPKSVVAFPFNRSRKINADSSTGDLNPSRAERTTRAYRGAYSRSACRADASSRPLRHQPGQSRAPAKTRFAPVSRYTSILFARCDIDFFQHIPNPDHTALNDACVDAAQMQPFAFRRVDKFHRFHTEPV